MKLRNLAILALLLTTFSLSAYALPSNAVFAFSPSGSQQLVLNGGAITLNATATGWYNQNGFHAAANTNYIAGVCGSSDACNGDDLDYRDFFVFNLANVTATITSASLSIGNGATGFISTNPSLTYTSWDVSTSIATLISNNTTLAIYNDLGSGTTFGSRVVTAADNSTQVGVTLNAAAIAALNGARGSSWAVGGSVGGQQVPEPASLLLIGLGFVGLAILRNRK